MSIIQGKKDIFSKIAAKKALTELASKKQKSTSSFSSINNKSNSISFLTDLIQALVGYKQLTETTVEILTEAIDDMELNVKKILKKELSNLVDCGINPSLPSFVKSNGDGIIIEVKKIDFFNILKTDPKSVYGKLLYNDVTDDLLESSDFNTFLFGVIQDDGNAHSWQGILDVTFNSVGNSNRPNNTLTIKSTTNYDSKPLNEFKNDYIDSLKLFNTENLVNKIIDMVYGSISVNLKRSTKQLEDEAKINEVIENLISIENEETINDSYFEFDNQTTTKILESVEDRKRGVIRIYTSEPIEASISDTTLTGLTSEMGTAVTIEDKRIILTKKLEEMGNQNASNSVNPSDKEAIKNNFIQNIINTLIKGIVGVILSPKVVLIVLVIFKIILGPDASFNDGVDFLKKNKNFIRALIKGVVIIIVKKLLIVALKHITKLVEETIKKKAAEKQTKIRKQKLSLTGVPQDKLNKLYENKNLA